MFHGKEGRRFESVRGLCKSAANRRFLFRLHLQSRQCAVGMEPFVERSGSQRAIETAKIDRIQPKEDGHRAFLADEPATRSHFEKYAILRGSPPKPSRPLAVGWTLTAPNETGGGRPHR
jgi:hypothetical protein